MFKVSRGLTHFSPVSHFYTPWKRQKTKGPEIDNELFQFREQISYELRQRPQFQIPWIHSFLVVQKALNFLGRRYGH